MRLRAIALLCCMASVGSALVHANAPAGFDLDIAASSSKLISNGVVMTLRIRHRIPEFEPPRVRVKLVDPAGWTLAEGEASVSSSGQSGSIAIVNLRLPSIAAWSTQDIQTMRVRYEIRHAGASVAAASGVFALSRIAAEAFRVTILTEGRIRPGTVQSVVVSATSLENFAPIRGARALVRLTLDADAKVVFEKSVVTDARGSARVEFPIPDLPGLDDGSVEVEAVYGAMESSAEAELSSAIDNRLLHISTDKRLYQPGQTLHARVLVVGPDRRAVPSIPVKLRVQDTSGETVFAREITTSRFGIAAVDVPLSEEAVLGAYDLIAELEDGEYDDGRKETSVLVSRYDLPNFTVAVTPDKSFYLPGDRATLTVSTQYLFGQPVPGGRVRILEVAEDWWYDPRDDDDESVPIAEGTCGSNGTFVATTDLADAFKEMANSRAGSYNDAPYVAEVTDPSTNRTERRRFDLRVTREPIHIAVVDKSRLVHGHPSSFFVVTSLADGTAVSCDVVFSESGEPIVESDGSATLTWQRIGSVRTNRYGVAYVPDAPITRVPDDEYQSRELRFEATASGNRKGSTVEEFHATEDDDARVTVTARRSVLAVGDPIEATITTTSSARALLVTAVRRGRILATKTVNARSGKAFVQIPYQPEFVGRVSIVASDPTGEISSWGDEMSRDSAGVLFPTSPQLNAKITPNRESYSPGEPFEATVSLADAAGTRAEGVMAVSVVDSAVEARASGSGQRVWGGMTELPSWAREGAGWINGVTLASLARRNTDDHVAPDLDLVAAALLSEDSYGEEIQVESTHAASLSLAFSTALSGLKSIIDPVLLAEERAGRSLPVDVQSFRSTLARHGISYAGLKDPWDSQLFVRASIYGQSMTSVVSSCGPDALPGTADDLDVTTNYSRYYWPTEGKIRAALQDYTTSTGRFVRDDSAYREALRRASIEPDTIRDWMGRPCEPRFSASGTSVIVSLKSAGSDGRFDSDRLHSIDDVTVVSISMDYFKNIRGWLNGVIEKAAAEADFPTNMESWTATLAAAGFDPAKLRDQYGSSPIPRFARLNRYANRVAIEKTATFGTSNAAVRAVTTPVTEQYDEICLVGPGPDLAWDTRDDVIVARFVNVVSSVARSETAPVAAPSPTRVFSTVGGALSGTVTDIQDSAVAGATVKLLSPSGLALRETTTNGSGQYSFENLTPARYTVRVEAAGFNPFVVDLVSVVSQYTTILDAELSPGMAGECVTVTSSDESITDISSNKSVTVVRTERRLVLPSRGRADERGRDGGPVNSTPRLRTYFPETVYWNPELVTDARGRATIQFPLADSITTWQLSVLASTEDGRIAFGSAEVLAFQPFFVDHDPPGVLTEGDRIGLPVIVRNYLDSAQNVDLSIAPAPWFTLEGVARRKVRVEAGVPSRQIFDMRVTASVDDGMHRVTGLGERASDAIEKPIDVHPDGQELTSTASAFFSGTGTLDVHVPDVILGSPRTTLKIYPNPMAHVVEALEGILQRPYGCGEQTVSSTYPSLLLLKHANADLEPALKAKATRYLRDGYERLKSYRRPDGGIGYWADSSSSNTALTAYALRFLLDCEGVQEVDAALLAGLTDYLVAAQHADGRWPAPRWYSTSDPIRDAMETAYVAGVLAQVQTRPSHANTKGADAVARAITFVSPIATTADEPYLTASLALVALDIGSPELADAAIARLAAVARTDGASSYWMLDTNTPFCSWGTAGRVETSARVVRALSRYAHRYPDGAVSAEARRLVDRGVLFLLKQKDGYGVWYSTQATISVLDALLEQGVEDDRANEPARSATVRIDGRQVAIVDLPKNGIVAAPIDVDLSEAVGPGKHVVEVAGSDGSQISAHVVSRHYVPWVAGDGATTQPNRAEKREASLRMAVEYDRLNAPVGQPVTCTVTAERIGHRGYGMLVAEIGLPPGNDVDRSSLDRAVSNSGWTVCQYDVLPDRVVVYLWPIAGGASFTFQFKTRYGVSALAAPSTVYDYYNPESSVVLRPPRFESVEPRK